MARRKAREPLARYTDPEGRRHRIVMRGTLVLDLCAQEMPRVVVELTDDEWLDQVRPLVFGEAFEEGYLARAARDHRPVCRTLTSDDARRGLGDRPASGLSDGERGGARRRAA
jgi:hypothetical protein